MRRVTATHPKTPPEKTSPGMVVLFLNRREGRTLESHRKPPEGCKQLWSSPEAVWENHKQTRRKKQGRGSRKGGEKTTAWCLPLLDLYTSKLLLLRAGCCALTLASISPIQAKFQFQSQAGTRSCSPNSSPSDRSDGYNTLRGEAGGEKSEHPGGFSGEKKREC